MATSLLAFSMTLLMLAASQSCYAYSKVYYVASMLVISVLYVSVSNEVERPKLQVQYQSFQN